MVWCELGLWPGEMLCEDWSFSPRQMSTIDQTWTVLFDWGKYIYTGFSMVIASFSTYFQVLQIIIMHSFLCMIYYTYRILKIISIQGDKVNSKQAVPPCNYKPYLQLSMSFTCCIQISDCIYFSLQTVLCPCVKGYHCKPFSKGLGRCTKDQDIKIWSHDSWTEWAKCTEQSLNVTAV